MPNRLSTFLQSRPIDWLNLFVWVVLAFYLLPVASMIVTAFMSEEQLADPHGPLYPAKLVRFSYKGKDDPVYNVPTAQGVKQWALVNTGFATSEFIDPQHPETGVIEWLGKRDSLSGVYEFSLNWQNFLGIGEGLDLPRMLGVTLLMVIVTEIGVLLSSIVVAYGFARFPVPGGNLLFYLMIATILIPDKVTHVPSYFFYFIFCEKSLSIKVNVICTYWRFTSSIWITFRKIINELP